MKLELSKHYTILKLKKKTVFIPDPDKYEFTFKTKSEYLAWRQAWKHDYKELTNSIREQKNIIRTTKNDIQSSAQYQRNVLNVKAIAYLELLQRAKKEAKRQMEETLLIGMGA